MEEIDARARAAQALAAPAVATDAPASGPALTPGSGLVVELGPAKRLEWVGGPTEVVDLGAFVGQRRGAVLALWATWCKPCIADEELALLEDLKARLPRDFPLISIACDGLDGVLSHEKAPRWIRPIWQIDDGHIRLLPQAFIQQNGLGLPVFLVVGPGGEVRFHRTQALDAAAVAALLTAAAP